VRPVRIGRVTEGGGSGNLEYGPKKVSGPKNERRSRSRERGGGKKTLTLLRGGENTGKFWLIDVRPVAIRACIKRLAKRI